MSDRIAQLATDFTELFNAFYRAPRYHLAVELALMLWVVWLLFFRKPRAIEKQLTEAEREELIAEWQPDPLVPPDDGEDDPIWMKRQIEGPVGHIVQVNNKPCINFATLNFLDLVGSERVAKRAIKALEKYGVGSCGPRGFYGTIDIHLELEERLAKLLDVEEAVLYSYGFSTLSSIIPAYAKRGDVIFADSCINYALQKGVQASRSDVYYFAHNDTRDLIRLLEEQRARDLENYRKAKVTRRFLVVESLYLNTGRVCPITDFVELRKEYKFRLILDESVAFGVLGERGRGLCELRNINRLKDVDIVCGSLEYALGSVGGFSAGSMYVVDHQRLSSLGYCFSASLPPLLAAAAMEGLDWLESEEGTKGLRYLRSLSQYLHKQLLAIGDLDISGESFSPIKHVRLNRSCKRDTSEDWTSYHLNFLDNVVQFAQKQGFLLTRTARLPDDMGADPSGSIRIAISVASSEKEINELCLIFRRALMEFMGKSGTPERSKLE